MGKESRCCSIFCYLDAALHSSAQHSFGQICMKVTQTNLEENEHDSDCNKAEHEGTLNSRVQLRSLYLKVGLHLLHGYNLGMKCLTQTIKAHSANYAKEHPPLTTDSNTINLFYHPRKNQVKYSESLKLRTTKTFFKRF